MIKIKIDSAKLEQAFKKAPSVVSKELRIEMKKTLRDVASYAKQHHRFHSRRGGIERAIQFEVGQSGLQGEIYLESAIAKHAKYIHEGTGLYGPRRKIIKFGPVTRKALYWVSGGRKNFARMVKIKGIRPDRFLYRAMRIKRQTIVKNFQLAAVRAFKKAGL